MRTKGAERGAISIGRRAQSYPADAAAIERRKHVPGGRHGAVNPAWNFFAGIRRADRPRRNFRSGNTARGARATERDVRATRAISGAGCYPADLDR
jgi:hypothetical protein